MLDKLTNTLDFQSRALVLRAQRQQLLASNIANADTPGYVGRDFRFAEALGAVGDVSAGRLGLKPSAGARANANADARHIAFAATGAGSEGGGYTVQTQPTLDGNSVDLDRERAAFADNAVRYEATLRFINGHGKTLLSAIQGQ